MGLVTTDWDRFALVLIELGLELCTSSHSLGIFFEVKRCFFMVDQVG
jgi:hypothetical protein